MELHLINQPLDTAFVNLASLLRHLQRNFFVGAVRVAMSDYEAEILLAENSQLTVTEHNIGDGQKMTGTEALERLLIRTREAGGAITVWQNSDDGEFVSPQTAAVSGVLPANVSSAGVEPTTENNWKFKAAPMLADVPAAAQKPLFSPEFSTETPFTTEVPQNLAQNVFQRQQTSVAEWREVVRLASDLIRTVELLINSMNMNFNSIFESVRKALAEDYPFLDPRRAKFSYSNGRTKLSEFSTPKIFLNGLSIALRQTIETAELIVQSHEFRAQLKERLTVLTEKRREQIERFNALSNFEYIVGETLDETRR